MADWVVLRPPPFSGEALFLSLKPNFSFLRRNHDSFRKIAWKQPQHHVVGLRRRRFKTMVGVQGIDQGGTIPFVSQEDEKEELTSNSVVAESVTVLKTAAKTRKVPKEEILSALSVLEKAKVDPSKFLSTLGGSESPGRTWMLIFTAEKKLTGGSYFPITAVQTFDAIGKRIENGVFLGPLGSLTLEGRISWKKRILAFIFERVRVTIGPLKPLEISLGNQEDREPTLKDPSFTWFYVDEELAVARGKSGGTAFWIRCRRVAS